MKIFIYRDEDFPLSSDNMFISNVYISLSDFKKHNPGMKPLVAYDADELMSNMKESRKKLIAWKNRKKNARK